MSNGVHIFWILSRGAGIAAILFAGLSVTIGLLGSRGMPFPKLRKNFELRPLHEALSMATIVLVAAHGLILLGDPWLKPGLAGISIPFVMSYRSLWTGIGIIAGYGLALLGLSYYLRRWIGPSRWRTAHRFIAIFWLLGLVHTFGAGTDAFQPWVWIPVALTSGPALVLLIMRLTHRGSKPAAAKVAGGPASAGTVMIDRH
ncbi:MAG: ferric reductase-like transmembrane domain-containing protein [Solirubrobacterales bacterium]|nr:ferric reductase-like transmembrane domain-containing protein [Solirubrobacterales bacterium]